MTSGHQSRGTGLFGGHAGGIDLGGCLDLQFLGEGLHRGVYDG